VAFADVDETLLLDKADRHNYNSMTLVAFPHIQGNVHFYRLLDTYL